MKFKRKILGLAVAAVATSFSISAISDEIPTPDAFDFVDASLLASTEVALNGKAEYATVGNARTAVTNTAGILEGALGNQADKNKQIADAQAAITAANALTAGQLIGGQTKAEILKEMNEDLGQSAAGVPDGTGYLSDITGLDTAVANATKNADDAAAALAAIESGAISNQLSSAAGYKAAASAQHSANGVASGNIQADLDANLTLGAKLENAEATLGTAAVAGGAAATELYLDVVNADQAVVDAKALITGGVVGSDAYTTHADYQAAAAPGTKAASSFTIVDGDMLDLRDGDTQLLFTVTTIGADEAALLEAINDEEGFSFTATGDGAGAITLTYDDADAAVEAYANWDAAKSAARTAVANISGDAGTTYTDGATVTTAGVDYTAANPLTYDLHVANMELAASEAAAALQVGIASEQLAQANYDAGLGLREASLDAETAAYAAAATAYTQVDSVLQEQLAQQNIVVAGDEATAVLAETAAAEDLAEVTSTAAALEVATTAETAAAADVADAQAAYTATGGATAENLAALNAATTAKTAATAAKNTAATAATAATDAYYGDGKTAATAIDLQDGTNAQAVSARKDVVTSQTVADGLSAQRALQVQIAADATNPAAVLQAALVAGDDTGGAVVAAANTNYQATQVNAAGISANVATLAVHEGLVTTNIANIATNTTNIATNTVNIATNTTNIATNTGNIATNTSNIASNTSSIADLSSSLADSTANLQRVEMQLNDDVDMLKSGIASALAIAGMPTAPGEGMGFSIGTGYYDGESAIAMGLTYVEGNRSYKFSLGNSGGETSASAGAAFKF